MGADVVKVNSAARPGNTPASAYYVMWNRNKRSLSLDMSRDDAKALCRRLCERADIVIDNFSAGVLDRWGVGYQSVRQANPGAIYVAMSGMGERGPWSNFVTYAPTVHALAGITALVGVPGREDIGIGFSYNDHLSGLHGAVAVLAALEARRRTGSGQRVPPHRPSAPLPPRRKPQISCRGQCSTYGRETYLKVKALGSIAEARVHPGRRLGIKPDPAGL
jgi:benzylsuccinate CoA-transferase BbsF subunit